MLEETYLKFKKNILPKMKKMQPNFQEPVVEYCEPEQVIDICSYNHYPILDKSSQKQSNSNDDKDIYDASELEHEFDTEFMKMCSKLSNKWPNLNELMRPKTKIRNHGMFTLEIFHLNSSQMLVK